MGPASLPLQFNRKKQQEGLAAGTDGSVDLRAEHMGAGFVVGTYPVHLTTLSIRVGGPIPTIRAEAASLLQAGCSSEFWPPHSPACICRLSSGPGDSWRSCVNGANMTTILAPARLCTLMLFVLS